MLVRSTILLLCLLGAVEIWRSRPLDIGYSKIVHSGLPHKQFLMNGDSITIWSGCRATNLNTIAPVRKAILRSCFRLPCLIQAGRMADVDYVLAGSIDAIGKSVLIGWRLVDTRSGKDDQVSATVVPYEEHSLETTVNNSLKEFLSEWSENTGNTDWIHASLKSRTMAGIENEKK